MKLLALNCPYCGGTIKFDIDTGKKVCFCIHCGQQIILDDEVIRTEHVEIIRDEAQIEETETKRIIRLKELELENTKATRNHRGKMVLTSVWLAISIVIIGCILAVIIIDPLGSGSGFLLGLLIFAVIGLPVLLGGGYLVFVGYTDTAKNVDIPKGGGVRLPSSIYNPMNGRVDYNLNYEDAEKLIKAAGFKNIITISEHDLKRDKSWSNKITSIRVDDQDINGTRKYYSPDVSVVIKYHGK